MTTRRLLSRLFAAGLVVAAVSAGVASARSAVTHQTSSCPNPEGGVCLGQLQAGTYRTKLFDATITYTVPDGWSNFEDTRGNFLLVPPWGNLPGVNNGTSDYIGVYVGVAAAKPGCDPGDAPDVAHTPSAIAQAIARNPGLDATRPTPVTIGGLQGLVLDIQMRKGWKQTCIYSGGAPVVQLITGARTSHLDHGIIPLPMKMRLYLLAHPGSGTLAVEVDDLAGGRHLKLSSSIVKRLRFAV